MGVPDDYCEDDVTAQRNHPSTRWGRTRPRASALARAGRRPGAHTLTLLDHADLPSGGRALELGCGPAGSIALLAERVGPIGIGDRNRHRSRPTSPWPDSWCGPRARPTSRCSRATPGPPACRPGRLIWSTPDCCWSIFRRRSRWSPRWSAWSSRAVGLSPTKRMARRGCAIRPTRAWDRLAAIFHAAYRSDGADLSIGRKLTALLRRRRAGGCRRRRPRRRLPRRPSAPDHPRRPGAQHARQDRRAGHRCRRTSWPGWTARSATTWPTRRP